MYLGEEGLKGRSLVHMNLPHQNHRSVPASPSRRSFSLGGGNDLEVRVLDDNKNDVTPRPLCPAEPRAPHVKNSRFFVDETHAGTASDLSATTASFTAPFPRSVFGGSRISSQSTMDSLNEETDDTIYKPDVPTISTAFNDVQEKSETSPEQLTTNMLDDLVDIFLSETDTISLLDIANIFVSAESDEAEAVKERNNRYVETCKSRAGSDKYLERSAQTLNEVTKNKQVQTDGPVMVDAAISAVARDIHDPTRVGDQDPADQESCPQYMSDSIKGPHGDPGILCLKEMETPAPFNTESDDTFIILSDKIHRRLLEVERWILVNIFQSKMAAYKQLPVLTDPDRIPRPETKEQKEEHIQEHKKYPALEYLWTFRCDLTRGHNIVSMACNKNAPDILAVAYGQFHCGEQKKGLICCWSPQNPTWPQNVFHCDSGVTSLDFSTHNPNQLAVGMYDGSIAVYNIHTKGSKTHVINSRACPNTHLHPVWQVKWTKQHISLMGEREEVLISVSADGRISKWFINNNGLECIDLMKLNRDPVTKEVQRAKRTDGPVVNKVNRLSVQNPALCLDFHPMFQQDTNTYLVGTWEGLIHKCSTSNNQQVLEVYKKHFCPVNAIAWCPFSPDLFLSCSSDWTIQLWKQDRPVPLLGFTTIKKSVYSISWSPKWATVFGAITEKQVEIWDLNSSILEPTIVLPAAPGVQLTFLQFATETNCIFIGNSDGEVTVYLLMNLNVGEGNQVDVLDGIIVSTLTK